MLVKEERGALVIQATNDLSYALNRVPYAIIIRQGRRPDSMPVRVELTLHATGKRINLNMKSPEGRTEIAHVLRDLKSKGIRAKIGKLSGKILFRLETHITLEYILGNCTGTDVVNDIQSKIQQLTNSGFSIKEDGVVGDEIHTAAA